MTNKYVDNMLNKVEELLSNDLIDVKKARGALKNTIRAKLFKRKTEATEGGAGA